jgi:hypothetical protein
MEAFPFLPEGEPRNPEIQILRVYEDGEVFHHLFFDGRDTGKIDWEESRDGREGYIDGLDGEVELGSLPNKKGAWQAIAACMREYHPSVRRIVHVDGDLDGIIELVDN